MLLLIFFAFTIPQNVKAISLISSSNSSLGGDVSSKTWQHTSSGINRLLVVGVGCRSYASVSSVTISGSGFSTMNLTRAVERSAGSGNFARSEIWYLVNPPVGVLDVTVTLSTSDWPSAVAVSFSGVNQATPIRANSNDYNTGVNTTTASLTINPTAVNDLALVNLSYWNFSSFGSVGSGQTFIRGATVDDAWRTAISTKPAVGATTAMSWTITARGEGWAMTGISMVPTADYTAPVISSVEPASSSFINTPTVSYTLSENASSASITFTTASPASQVICNLQGSALDAGAHTNLLLATGANACASFSSLYSNSVYSITFNATDTSGNVGSPVTITGVTYDSTAPIITINNPDSSVAETKTITASTNEGVLTMAVNASNISICNSSLTFIPYASITFTEESDNNRTVCYRAVDTAGNITYSISNPISGITLPQANAAPIVLDIDFNEGDDINLVAGGAVAVSVSAKVYDEDGYLDIDTVTAKIYRSGVSGAQNCVENINNCYNAVCQLSNCSGNLCDVVCSTDLLFTAEHTVFGGPYVDEYWLASIEATDIAVESGEGTSIENAVEVNSLLAIEINPEEIDYGLLNQNENTGAVNQVVTLTNIGNRAAALELSGTNACRDIDPDCLGGANAVILPNNHKYLSIPFTYSLSGVPLTSVASGYASINIAKPTSNPSTAEEDIYWGLAIPAGQLSGTYSSEIDIVAIEALACGYEQCNSSADCGGAACNTYYRDADADSFGNALCSIKACGTNPPIGYIVDDTDADDAQHCPNSGYNPPGTCLKCVDGAYAIQINTEDVFEECNLGDDGENASCNAPSCSGVSASCSVVAAATVCRTAKSVCDIEESCDGISSICPSDQVQAESYDISATTNCAKCNGVDNIPVPQISGEDLWSECASFSCASNIWGWGSTLPNSCRVASSNTSTNGMCNGAGSCFSGLATQCVEGSQSGTAACGSSACQRPGVCSQGTTPTSTYDTVAEVCYTDGGQHNCSTNYGCDATGTCVLQCSMDGVSCSIGTDCCSGTCSTYYTDADGDRYRPSGYSTIQRCGTAAITGYVSSSQVLAGTDCCDSDNAAFPGQTTYQTRNTNCGGSDFNCSGSTTYGDSSCRSVGLGTFLQNSPRYDCTMDSCNSYPTRNWYSSCSLGSMVTTCGGSGSTECGYGYYAGCPGPCGSNNQQAYHDVPCQQSCL